MYRQAINNLPGEQVWKRLFLWRRAVEIVWQKVGADSRFLRWDLVALQEDQAGLLMGQLAASDSRLMIPFLKSKKCASTLQGCRSFCASLRFAVELYGLD
ncbi:hypothetical protein EYF80_000169 [Liparis tanakae]|uniref:Uncharacterized protein n=1 Tax=Liparis tanakae TaxID=230148 RepID=A0A4Z2JGZ9_9TELE|nr:hypothetical protein EYF80_000169 [Liparis tanakae]